MKKVLFIGLCIIFVAGIFVKYQYDSAIKDPIVGEGRIEVEVKSGDSFYSVLSNLENENKIKNSFAIKYYIKKNSLQCDIKSGKYIIDGDVDLETLISKLTAGGENSDVVRVTVIEGMNVEEIAEALEEKEIISATGFLEAVKNYSLPRYIKSIEGEKYSLEGYLYPDTYEFVKGTSANEIIGTMLNRFEDIIKEIEDENNIKIENLAETVTLASIIEKETSLAEERKIVSSVFHNRLDQNQMLQSCATVIYAIGNDFYKRENVVLYNKDLEIESPYNTYRNTGLPIGPIGVPRKECIEAALFPADTDYLYFVLTKDRTHFFTKDYNEFLRVKEESGL